MVDYLFFRDSPWSPISLLTKAWIILGRIFGPLLDPALYYWVSEVAAPVGMIVLGIVLLYVSVAKAKVAMRKVTPSMEEAFPRPDGTGDLALDPLPHSVIDYEPRVAQIRTRPYGLFTKLSVAFGMLGLLFGITVCVFVYHSLLGAFESAIKSRAKVFVTTLAEVAERSIAEPGADDLARQVEKYTSVKSVVYVYVEDAAGRIVANIPQDLPRFLRRDFPKTAERAIKGVDVEYQGVPVYEVATRFGDGKAGYVHLGMRRDAFEDEARRTTTPIAASILVVLLMAIGVFVWTVAPFGQSFSKLVDYADRVSRGDLDLVMGVKQADEIGEIAQSFERMRSSLYAVLKRLEQESFSDEPGEKSWPPMG
jgi:HAMP domain-containing protein